MRADLTRNSFDPAKYFSRVLMQQGRVQLDADWNEQASILLHLVRRLAADLGGNAASDRCRMTREAARWDQQAGDPSAGGVALDRPISI